MTEAATTEELIRSYTRAHLQVKLPLFVDSEPPRHKPTLRLQHAILGRSLTDAPTSFRSPSPEGHPPRSNETRTVSANFKQGRQRHLSRRTG